MHFPINDDFTQTINKITLLEDKALCTVAANDDNPPILITLEELDAEAARLIWYR